MSSSDYQGRVNCFSTKVHLLARGSPLDLDLFRPLPLSVVLGGPEAQGLLLSSSDLTRVKLTRTDPKTGKTTGFIEDVASNPTPAEDLQPRDGDVIEVPEKEQVLHPIHRLRLDMPSIARYSPRMISKELVAASTVPLVLAVLTEGDSYGYALIQRVRELSGDRIAWTEGMLYPVLHWMEKKRLIKSEWRQGETGRRRKYYRLQQQGRKALETEKQQWMTVHETLNKLWKPQPHLT